MVIKMDWSSAFSFVIDLTIAKADLVDNAYCFALSLKAMPTSVLDLTGATYMPLYPARCENVYLQDLFENWLCDWGNNEVRFSVFILFFRKKGKLLA